MEASVRCLVASTLFLAGCAETFEDRLSELDAQCGHVTWCATIDEASSVIACMESNLAAGIAANATFEIHIDPVAIVYALDGSYVSLEGFYDFEDHPNFVEYRCRGLRTIPDGTRCTLAGTADCETIREWSE